MSGRKLSQNQRALLEQMAHGSTLTSRTGGSGMLHHTDGRTPTYVAFQTWDSLMRRRLIAWCRPGEMLPTIWSGFVGRITDAGRAALEATP